MDRSHLSISDKNVVRAIHSDTPGRGSTQLSESLETDHSYRNTSTGEEDDSPLLPLHNDDRVFSIHRYPLRLYLLPLCPQGEQPLPVLAQHHKFLLPPVPDQDVSLLRDGDEVRKVKVKPLRRQDPHQSLLPVEQQYPMAVEVREDQVVVDVHGERRAADVPVLPRNSEGEPSHQKSSPLVHHDAPAVGHKNLSSLSHRHPPSSAQLPVAELPHHLPARPFEHLHGRPCSIQHVDPIPVVVHHH
eukprot:422220-Hanusia_phi.AAC.3